MASLPEDDGPTMVGAPGEQRVATRLPTGHDGEGPAEDTTSTLLGPPVAPPAHEPVSELSDDDLDSDDDDDEPEEHTVQQAMPPAVAAAAARARSAPIALTKPSNQPVPGIGPPAREAAKTDATDLTDDDEPLEDSITATAPRLNASNLMEAAQSGRGVPLSIPGRVEIRTLDDDDDAGDETEVRTLPGHGALAVPAALRDGAALPAPRPAAGRPPEIAREPEPDPEPDGGPDDDGVTTQAAAPRLGSVPDIGAPLLAPSAGSAPSSAAIVDEPPTRPGIGSEPEEPLTRPGLGAEGEPPTRPGLEGAGEPATRPGLADPPTGKVERKPDSAGYANDQDDDESVTSRGPAAEPYVDDSVTTQAPNVPLELIHAAIKAADAAAEDGSLDDSSADTTQKVRKPRAASTVPADEEAESITTQAPGHVTNMLRVIASGSSPDIGKRKVAPIDDEDEGPENRTAVMANAPLKRVIDEVESSSRLPAIRPTGGPLSHGPMGAAAPRLEPSSESGLRVARSGSGSNERASLGQLLVSGDARSSGAHPASLANDGSMSSSMDRAAGADLGPLHPSLHDVDLGKGPSYGLLVAIVAVISIVVPVTLFVILRHGSDVPPQAVPGEPASEVAKPGPGVLAARGKAPRGKNGLTIVPSAAVSASAAPPPSAAPSSAPSGKPGSKGFPFRR